MLHIDGCPHREDAGWALAEAIEELRLTNVTPTFVLIRTPEDADNHRLADSPTILIDGVDAVKSAHLTTDLACHICRNSPPDQRTEMTPIIPLSSWSRM